MANLKASIKGDRQNKRRAIYNSRMKRRFRSVTKSLNSEITSGNLDAARNQLPRLYKLIDKAAKKGIIKGNTASRKKARITKRINKLAAPDVKDSTANS